ncbi:MAG: transglycosylase [Micavibrio sp.]|nr:transglycosylase [Micavibrio sp.]
MCMIAQVLASCLFIASQTYQVPPAVLMGIQTVEGGQVGQAVKNKNGSYDLGPMQINTIWIPELAKYWNVDQATAIRWVKDDPCTNINVSAWILRQHINETGSLSQAIAHYHSRTPYYGRRYKKKVVEALQKKGLISIE